MSGTRISEGRERIPAEMSYKEWRSNGGTELYRQQPPPELPYKPVSEERYNQLIIPLKKMGVTIMRGSEEVERYLDLRGAEGDTLDAYTVLFKQKVSISSILEETHHVRQNRRGLNDDKDIRIRGTLNEIDAKKYLLRVAGRYKIPREEIEATKIQLKEYEKILKEYEERLGNGT